ncbi:hypothetical protein SEA_KABOCHA_40 [Gordonia phage Kabocha]|uniref:Uncharacterized protein n=1 Tax=Gordonia phage Chidiebere TaxID=2656530 RepID=A0A649VKK5_9CAUD|nr:tail fiber protein [Gordonia phage Chidiebere]AZS07893.1 hypothetical protein PBI_GRAY_39 [Gordonia phage Gray]WAA19827.1 hypothetical protein SEA_KABOCHA_40 [Gordonia phage Kabocha]WAA20017.1 hypothetical protein SEA_HANEM_39 [Gordonia phage Hanem]WNM67059.1 hypothetical protein SEA_SCHOMBER_38 [Gordonia Phage Schomber]QGJ92930.1 hypothetical protein PBI_CHIDIEBERE_39 [Gordonia phage Chidiebere]
MTARKMASNLDANGKKIINLPAPTAGSTEAARQVDVETAQAFAISRANHTGTQLAATISNFDTQVRTTRLDQMAAPTASVALNSQRITNLGTPSAGTDAATKTYVDNQVAGLTSGQIMKGAVRALVKSNVTISAPGATLDGIAAVAGDVFWLGSQTTASENGPWVWNGAAAAMTRPANFNSTTPNVYIGSYWVITGGTSADAWLLLTNDAFTLGTTAATYKVIDVAQAAAAPYEGDLGDGSTQTFTVTHNLNTKAVAVHVFRNASPFDEIDVYITRPSVNTVTIEPDEVWSANQYHVVVAKL